MRRSRNRFVKRAMIRNNWHMSKTAKSFRMYRSQLYHIITTDPELNRLWRRGREALRRRQRQLRKNG